MNKELTPQACFDALRPMLQQVINACDTAPLSDAHKSGLMVLVATHFWGVAIAAGERAVPTGRPNSVQAREIFEHIISGMELSERPKIVK